MALVKFREEGRLCPACQRLRRKKRRRCRTGHRKAGAKAGLAPAQGGTSQIDHAASRIDRMYHAQGSPSARYGIGFMAILASLCR